jgi:hypothetical protein
MQQNERIELIKAAVELTKILTAYKVSTYKEAAMHFEFAYDLLQGMLEGSNNADR